MKNTLKRIKTTVYIDKDNQEMLESLLPKGERASFMNSTLRQSLSQMQKERNKKQALSALFALKKVRDNNTSTICATEIVKELRNEIK